MDSTHRYSMSAMFMICKTLSELDVSKWKTSSVIDMSNMFYGCSSLIELDVKDWDVKMLMI